MKLYKCGNCETLARQRSQQLTVLRGALTPGGACLFESDLPLDQVLYCPRCGDERFVVEYTPKGRLCRCRLGDPEEPIPHSLKGGAIISGPVCLALFDYEGPLNRTVRCPACNAEQTPQPVEIK